MLPQEHCPLRSFLRRLRSPMPLFAPALFGPRRLYRSFLLFLSEQGDNCVLPQFTRLSFCCSTSPITSWLFLSFASFLMDFGSFIDLFHCLPPHSASDYGLLLSPEQIGPTLAVCFSKFFVLPSGVKPFEVSDYPFFLLLMAVASDRLSSVFPIPPCAEISGLFFTPPESAQRVRAHQ